MSRQLAQTFKVIFLLALLAAVVFLITSKVHANRMNAIIASGASQLNPPSPEFKIQTAEQDQCLHCHIAGSFENLWVPTTRWAIFGSSALIVFFGITRSASVWRKRAEWVPFTTRAGNWINERYQTKEVLEKFLKKPVPIWATRWWYCLGGITAFLFIIQGLTGTMLAFYYRPTPADAYASIQFIENEVFFGASIRAIHHWSANGMIVMCIAHMLRVFIIGAFKRPRELNWVSGVALLITTLAFGFTGYLLPWDQRAYWATTVGTEIAGGIPDIGGLILIFLRVGWGITETTLSRFYALHILVLPILVIATMGAHFLMVRRQGLKTPL